MTPHHGTSRESTKTQRFHQTDYSPSPSPRPPDASSFVALARPLLAWIHFRFTLTPSPCRFDLPAGSQTPYVELFSGASEHAIDLLEGLLVFDPPCRLSVDQALDHPYFQPLR